MFLSAKLREEKENLGNEKRKKIQLKPLVLLSLNPSHGNGKSWEVVCSLWTMPAMARLIMTMASFAIVLPRSDCLAIDCLAIGKTCLKFTKIMASLPWLRSPRTWNEMTCLVLKETFTKSAIQIFCGKQTTSFFVILRIFCFFFGYFWLMIICITDE